MTRITGQKTKTTALKAGLKGALVSAGAIALIAVPLASAQARDSGQSVKQARDVASFTRVQTSGSTDVSIRVGPAQSVVVHARDNEIEQIKTFVKNGELRISRDSKRKMRRTHNARVVITVPALSGLETQGSGDAVVENMKAKTFRLVQQGSGDVEIDGTCDEIKVTSQGSGDLESDRLICDRIDVRLRGSGDMEMDNVKAATVKIDAVGSGDVVLEGSCGTFDLEHKASGDVDARRLECTRVSVDAAGSGDMRVFASQDVTIKVHGSGDVEVYGGGKASEISTSGSGHVRVHK